VGPDVNVDLTAGQVMHHVEPPMVLGDFLSIASLHKGIPQQYGEVVMVQTPRRYSTSSLPSEIRFQKIIIFKE
jgi:hypothetical protein